MSVEILKKYKIKAKKSLGQNFLVNDLVVEDISNIIDINGKNIVEVGPGYGALTEKLLDKKPKSLNLVEIDKSMIEILNNRIELGDFSVDSVDFKINNIDVLKYNPGFKSYNIMANIPYYITSPILRHFLYDVENKPEKMVILMQEDVGDKIIAGCEYIKGKIRSSVLSLFIAKKTSVKKVFFVGKENFIPEPKIESSVLLFELHGLYKDIDDNKFLDVIKKGFSSPRKKLIKNLTHAGFNKEVILGIFKELGFEENIRAESLDIEKWCSLVKVI